MSEPCSGSEDQHRATNADGVGKCSVPMWIMGCPAGFCDKPAYGEPPPSKTYYSYGAGRTMRMDGRYEGYVPGLACVGHGGPKSRVFMDGAAYCAVFPDFIDLQTSPAGFGQTPEAARQELTRESGRDAT